MVKTTKKNQQTAKQTCDRIDMFTLNRFTQQCKHSKKNKYEYNTSKMRECKVSRKTEI